MIGYKIVRPWGTKLYSCRINIHFHRFSAWKYKQELTKYRIKYLVGEFVYPNVKDTKLFFFNSLKEARWFKVYGEEIWKCKANGATEIRYISHLMGENDMYWEAVNNNLPMDRISTQRAPHGTYGASAIKLLERVDKDV